MTITFFGGAGGVTGSKHVIEAAGARILLDCGTFQGLPDTYERNRSLPFDASSIDAVVLSHAHIDHCGLLPLLVKQGFSGPIFATAATRDVARLMLKDMAGIEEQDADFRARHGVGRAAEQEPLFTRDDITPTIERFVAVPYVRASDAWFDVGPGVRLKLYDAGHILGSAISMLEFQEDGRRRSVAYTGDVGPAGMPLMHNPQPPREEVETLLLESTYGSREHENFDLAVGRLAEAVQRVCGRGGKMIIPAFSLGRTQTLVYILHRLTDTGRIPRFPIYVDSPLAVDLTDVYRENWRDYDVESEEDFAGDDHRPLAFRNLTYIRSVRESKELNNRPGPFMVISASGMMTNGRVVHHLRHSIGDERNAILITGYQALGTLGRKILEGAPVVDLYGSRMPVKAEVLLFNEFSAHADRRQLQRLAEAMPGVQRVFLVHGEPHQADDLRVQLQSAHPDWEVHRPEQGAVVHMAS
jgi:metallo-beta-lactamase family protein